MAPTEPRAYSDRDCKFPTGPSRRTRAITFGVRTSGEGEGFRDRCQREGNFAGLRSRFVGRIFNVENKWGPVHLELAKHFVSRRVHKITFGVLWICTDGKCALHGCPGLLCGVAI